MFLVSMMAAMTTCSARNRPAKMENPLSTLLKFSYFLYKEDLLLIIEPVLPRTYLSSEKSPGSELPEGYSTGCRNI